MFRRPLWSFVLGVAVLAGVATGCSADEVTKAQYLDHAVEFSTSAKTDEQQAGIRKMFDCAWPAMSKDEDLLDDFMAATKSNDDLSERISPLLAKCIQIPTTTTTTTTTPVPGSRDSAFVPQTTGTAA